MLTPLHGIKVLFRGVGDWNCIQNQIVGEPGKGVRILPMSEGELSLLNGLLGGAYQSDSKVASEVMFLISRW